MSKKDKTNTPKSPEGDLAEQKEKTGQEAKENAKSEKNVEEKAKSLMLQHKVDKIYKVGSYWFTKLIFAEAEAKKSGKKIQTFEK